MDAIESSRCVDSFKTVETVAKSNLQAKRSYCLVTTGKSASGPNYVQTLCEEEVVHQMHAQLCRIIHWQKRRNCSRVGFCSE